MDDNFSPPAQVMRPVPVPYQMFSKDLIQPKTAAVLAGIGVLVFFVGTVLVQSSLFINRGDADYADYYNLLKNVIGVGKILNWLGAMTISLPLYIVGISNDKLDWKVRASMLSTATAIIVATMIVTMFISPPSSAFYY